MYQRGRAAVSSRDPLPCWQVAAAPPFYDEDLDHHGPPLVERLPASFSSMKRQLQEIVADIKQLNLSQQQLSVNYNHLIELSHVLQKARAWALPRRRPARPLLRRLSHDL